MADNNGGRRPPPVRRWATPEIIIGVGGLIVAAIFGFAQCSSPTTRAPQPEVRPPATGAPPTAAQTSAAGDIPSTSPTSPTLATSTPSAIAEPTLVRTCTFDSRDEQAIDLDSCRMIPFVVGGSSPPLGIDITLGNNGRLSTNDSQTHGLFKLLDPTIQSCETAIQSGTGMTDTLENYNSQLYQGSAFCMVTRDGTTAIVTVTKATPTPDSSFDGGISLKADLYK
jgi:hypothetical protein